MSESNATPQPEPFVCACESWMRDACIGEGFFREFQGKPFCVLHYPCGDKGVEFELARKRKFELRDFDFRGVWFSEPFGLSGVFEKGCNFQDATFCKGVSFNNVEFAVHVSFISTHFASSVDFSRAQFMGGANFGETRFDGPANFNEARFLGHADFHNTEFTQANFRRTSFAKGADFGQARFNDKTNFTDASIVGEARFSGAHFRLKAEFVHAYFLGDVYFIQTAFSGEAHFHLATFMDPGPADLPGAINKSILSFAGARFGDSFVLEKNNFGQGVLLNLPAATFDHPERFTLHSCKLRPAWFIGVDPRKFSFINVEWGPLDSRKALQNEIKHLELHERLRHVPLLEIAFRQLAVNAEENNRYEEAANFRYLAMEAKRNQSKRKVDPSKLSWWYWLLSGYGERVRRALGVLVFIWFLFGVIYWTGGSSWWQAKEASPTTPLNRGEVPISEQHRTLAPFEALIYSAGVLTLQKPEPHPANKRARLFVLVETIVGPIQAALLALAIRRKFMR